MANIYFSRKVASDELLETLFFATGTSPTKEKSKDFTLLKADQFEAKVYSSYRIEINKVKCKSISEVKNYIGSKIL